MAAVGSSIDKIETLLNSIVVPDSKRIIELRFGLVDGIEHTLYEVADILNEEKHSEKRMKEFFKNKDITKMYEFMLGNVNWSAEDVRRDEASTLIELKTILNSYNRG